MSEIKGESIPEALNYLFKLVDSDTLEKIWSEAYDSAYSDEWAREEKFSRETNVDNYSDMYSEEDAALLLSRESQEEAEIYRAECAHSGAQIEAEEKAYKAIYSVIYAAADILIKQYLPSFVSAFCDQSKKNI